MSDFNNEPTLANNGLIGPGWAVQLLQLINRVQSDGFLTSERLAELHLARDRIKGTCEIAGIVGGDDSYEALDKLPIKAKAGFLAFAQLDVLRHVLRQLVNQIWHIGGYGDAAGIRPLGGGGRKSHTPEEETAIVQA